MSKTDLLSEHEGKTTEHHYKWSKKFAHDCPILFVNNKKRSVLDINLTCCYDKRTFIYTGGVGWERINLGLCAPGQHHR